MVTQILLAFLKVGMTFDSFLVVRNQPALQQFSKVFFFESGIAVILASSDLQGLALLETDLYT